MPVIPKTPSPRSFADAWSKEFKEAVTRASGTDGRLTLSEAKKLATRPDADKFFADNVARYFADTGKKSVSVKVITSEMHAYALRAATQAAGADGKLSLPDGTKLPDELKEDFFYLRGKAMPAQPPSPSGLAGLAATVAARAVGLNVMSESDAQVKFVGAPGLGAGPIDEAAVRTLLGAQHDALAPTIYGYANAESLPLSQRAAVEERDAMAWLERMSTPSDPGDPESVAQAAKFRQLAADLTGNLSGLKLYRFGEVDISVFVVGRTTQGDLAGVMTCVVET